MWYYFVLFVTVSCANIDLTRVHFPSEYTATIEKISLDSGLVEELTIWRTETKSRVDRDGVVSSIIDASENENATKYYIHPEFHEGVEKVCTTTTEDSDTTIELEDFLPDVDSSFKYVGKASMNEHHCSKYESRDKDENYETRNTLWAVYKSSKGWVPVRYEEYMFDVQRGTLQTHTITNFYNYHRSFDEDVFDVPSSCYESSSVISTSLDANAFDENAHIERAFSVYKKMYNKEYADKKEHMERLRIFQKNLRLIAATNAQNLGYTLSLNQFADSTPEEMRKHKGLLRKELRLPSPYKFPYSNSEVQDIYERLPKEYNLVLEGIMTPIQNQKSCGSCYAFASSTVTSGAIARSNGGRLVKLAVQAMIDCSWEYNNEGCGGGTDTSAYKWMMKYGLPTEEEYGTYQNSDGSCNISNMTQKYPIRGYVDVTPHNVEAIKVALVNHGPLTISFGAGDDYKYYSGGIFSCTKERVLDHEMVLVGYGERYGETFWIVQNSWGPTWGIDGYMLVSSTGNGCGISVEPTYVIV